MRIELNKYLGIYLFIYSIVDNCCPQPTAAKEINSAEQPLVPAVEPRPYRPRRPKIPDQNTAEELTTTPTPTTVEIPQPKQPHFVALPPPPYYFLYCNYPSQYYQQQPVYQQQYQQQQYPFYPPAFYENGGYGAERMNTAEYFK